MLRGMEFLTEAENRESFFRRISYFFPTLDPRYKEIERAYNTVKDAFEESTEMMEKLVTSNTSEQLF